MISADGRTPTPEEVDEYERQRRKHEHNGMWFQYSLIAMQAGKMITLAEEKFGAEKITPEGIAKAAARLADLMMVEFDKRQ